MWIMLNDAFLSIVHKDCHRTELLVRARRKGDIERIFSNVNVTRSTDTDYLFRAVVPRHVVEQAIVGELRRITYSNFKDTVEDEPLHNAYLGVWQRMSKLQNPPPFSSRQFNRGDLSPDADIDTSDIPEAGEDFFRVAKVRKRRPNDHTAWSPDKRPAKKSKKRSLRKGR